MVEVRCTCTYYTVGNAIATCHHLQCPYIFLTHVHPQLNLHYTHNIHEISCLERFTGENLSKDMLLDLSQVGNVCYNKTQKIIIKYT